jgi:hypothetical protein
VKGFALIAGTLATYRLLYVATTRWTSFLFSICLHSNNVSICLHSNNVSKCLHSNNVDNTSIPLGLIITGLAQWIIDKKALAAKDW